MIDRPVKQAHEQWQWCDISGGMFLVNLAIQVKNFLGGWTHDLEFHIYGFLFLILTIVLYRPAPVFNLYLVFHEWKKDATLINLGIKYISAIPPCQYASPQPEKDGKMTKQSSALAITVLSICTVWWMQQLQLSDDYSKSCPLVYKLLNCTFLKMKV